MPEIILHACRLVTCISHAPSIKIIMTCFRYKTAKPDDAADEESARLRNRIHITISIR
jgi:hypothetical protein